MKSFVQWVFFVAIAIRYQGYSEEIYDCNTKFIIQTIKLIDTMHAGDVIARGSKSLTLEEKSPFTDAACTDIFITINNTIELVKNITKICINWVTCSYTCAGQLGRLVIRTEFVRTQHYNIMFDRNVYNVSVPEMASNGTQLLLNPSLKINISDCNYTQDFDMGITYKLQDSTQPFFWRAEVMANSLYVTGDIDYESHPNYTLIIVAILSKLGNSSATATIFVNVTDVDDNNPRFNISDGEEYKLNIPEGNITNNTFQTIPPIFAFDPDTGINQTIVYSIIEKGQPGLFSINNSTGIISVLESLDRENISTYRLLIKAAQIDKQEYKTAIATLVVNVLDVDDNKPKFSPSEYHVRLMEHASNGTVICVVNAVDADETVQNTKFTYRLISNDSSISIFPDNGTLYVSDSSKLTMDSNCTYNTLKVGTLTSNNSTGDDMATIYIEMIDVNDNNPQFIMLNYIFDFNNLIAGTKGQQITAIDADCGNNGNITYSLLNETTSCDNCVCSSLPFDVDAFTGELLSNNKLYEKSCTSFRVRAQACDSPNAIYTRRCNFTTIVVNMNMSTASSYSQNLSVSEGSANNTLISVIECHGYGRKYKYNNTETKEFAIDDSTGVIKTAAVLDRETTKSYNFIVNVTDATDQVLCIVIISVQITDVNDNQPVFNNTSYIFTLPEHYMTGFILGNIQATDKDADKNAEISYQLWNARESTITVDSSTGYISIKSIPVEEFSRFILIAKDNGNPPLTNSVPVIIIGDSGNDTIPISTQLTRDQIKNIQTKLEWNISLILNMRVHIQDITNLDSTSRIHFSAVNISKMTLASAVYDHYDEIRALLYEASQQMANDNEHKNQPFGAPEIGLISMAVVILIGTILAIVVIYRQLRSQKQYKSLYEGLTRSSSMYESQEIKVDMKDETSDYNGSLNTQDSAVEITNPLYQNVHTDSEHTKANITQDQQQNTTVKDVIESLDLLSARLNNEDSDTNNREEENQSIENLGDRLDGDLEKNHILEHKYVNASAMIASLEMSSNGKKNQGLPSENDNKIDGNAITSPNYVHVGLNQDQSIINWHDAENVTEVVLPSSETKIADEPDPDYNTKQVRFHSEVLDADENKLKPLKEKTDNRNDMHEEQTRKSEDYERPADRNRLLTARATDKTEENDLPVHDHAVNEDSEVDYTINDVKNTKNLIDDEVSTYF